MTSFYIIWQHSLLMSTHVSDRDHANWYECVFALLKRMSILFIAPDDQTRPVILWNEIFALLTIIDNDLQPSKQPHFSVII